MAINIDELGNEISRQLRTYTENVQKDVNKAAQVIARKGALELKRSTTGDFKNITGNYRRGWRAKKVKGSWVVYNATDYQLTHLLEEGTQRNGRPHSPAFEHIKPVEQQIIQEFTSEVTNIINDNQ